MRTARRSSPFDDFSDALRAFLSRRAMEIVGLGLLALSGAAILALATWSVEDPSLNHATTAPVRNLLKLPGAVAADLSMQLLGLGSVALAVPLAAWGWRLVRTGGLDRLPLRLALWIVGTGATAAMASSLPPTQRWPLPTGLGGVAGDGLLHAATVMTGIGGGPLSALLGFGFAAIAILATTAACGFGFADGEEPRGREAERPSRRPPFDPGRGRRRAGRRARLGHRLRRRPRPCRHEPQGRPAPPLGGVAGGMAQGRRPQGRARRRAGRPAPGAPLRVGAPIRTGRPRPDHPRPPARARPDPARAAPLDEEEDGFDAPLAPFEPPARPEPQAGPASSVAPERVAVSEPPPALMQPSAAAPPRAEEPAGRGHRPGQGRPESRSRPAPPRPPPGPCRRPPEPRRQPPPRAA
jgi:S-DNA-T family DNA segregation ATPase FtsK/SpoIIIE